MSVFKPQLAGIIALSIVIFTITLFWEGQAQARDWYVPSEAPTVQAAIDSCVTGDVIVLAPGVYDDCTNPNGNNVLHIGVLISGVSIRGESGDPQDVILDAGSAGRCLEMRNLSGDVVIEAVTLRRGKASNPLGSGGGVFVYNSEPVFRNCVFDSCGADFAGGGISVSHGALTVEDCVFKSNYTANIGAAIRVTSSATTINGSTIYGSVGAAVHYASDDISIENTIIAGGDAEALVQNTSADPDPVLSCVNFHGNDVDYGDFFSDQNGQDGNISIDPLFCSPISGDLTLYAVSPCAEANTGSCGQIGALPVGCGGSADVHMVLANGMGDYPTIQAAINAAAEGDTIALADGTFVGDGNRDLDFSGKAITVMGLSGDPGLVMIDCQGSSDEPHRGFHFHNGEGGFSILRDVTVTNAWVALHGASVLCESDPKIMNCIFKNGHANYGAGIYCDGGSPQIVDCAFLFNEGRERGGGAAFFNSQANLMGSFFHANWGSRGGAVFLPDSSSVVMENCTLTGNLSAVDKACVGLDGNSNLSIVNCMITYNNRLAVRNYGTGLASITGSNVFENTEGDYADGISGNNNVAGNISQDPLYCDTEADDFTLRGDSPCTSYNAPDGQLMGAFEVGCSAPDVFICVSELIPGVERASEGASWVDINNDGHLDVVVTNIDSENEVLLGDGTGDFTDGSFGLVEHGGATLGTNFGDIDNDGDLDLYVDILDVMNLLALNDGGEFAFIPSENTQIDRIAGRSSWADFNNDGNLDLYIVSQDTAGVLMSGDGSGGFTMVESSPLSNVENSTASVWADFNNDGFRDLYVVQDNVSNTLFGNIDGVFSKENGLLNNSGAGKSAAWGDYDNDGYLDLYLVNDGEPNQLFRNKGNGSFEDKTSGALADAGPGRSGIWGDWDNDGDLDLFITNSGASDRLLRNEGNSVFYAVGASVFAASDSSTGCSFGDYDNNGTLDLLVAVRGDSTRVYRNQATMGRHYLKVDLTRFDGMAGAPGARVRIVTLDSLVQIREVGSSVGYNSSNPLTVHFGLDEATMVDSLTVRWPGGRMTELHGIAADQLLQITEPDAEVVPVLDGDPVGPLCQLLPCYPNPFNPATIIQFRLAKGGQASVKVFDVAGRLVKTIVSDNLAAGWHNTVWRGKDQKDRTVAAGVYFVRVDADGETETRSVTLVK